MTLSLSFRFGVSTLVFALVSGCAPRFEAAEKAGYYSAFEKRIRHECEKIVYGRGVYVGPHLVHSNKERSQAVDKVVKARIYNKNLSSEKFLEDYNKGLADVEALDKKIESCEKGKGSRYREKLRAEIAAKKA